MNALGRATQSARFLDYLSVSDCGTGYVVRAISSGIVSVPFVRIGAPLLSALRHFSSRAFVLLNAWISSGANFHSMNVTGFADMQ
jgi:hypothetical protein